MKRKMSWKRMWLHIAKGFDNPRLDYGTSFICPTLSKMFYIRHSISRNMYDRANKAIEKALRGRVVLYEFETVRGCKLRAAFCRRQALKGT